MSSEVVVSFLSVVSRRDLTGRREKPGDVRHDLATTLGGRGLPPRTNGRVCAAHAEQRHWGLVRSRSTERQLHGIGSLQGRRRRSVHPDRLEVEDLAFESH